MHEVRTIRNVSLENPPADSLATEASTFGDGSEIPLSTAHFWRAAGADTAIGFVLIDIEPTREKEIYAALMKIGQIVELYPLFGEYDRIAQGEADSYDAISAVVVSERQPGAA